MDQFYTDSITIYTLKIGVIVSLGGNMLKLKQISCFEYKKT